MTYERHFNAALGYYNLGMLDQALQELQPISKHEPPHPEVFSLKISIFMQMKHWADAIQTGRELIDINPKEEAAYIDIAFCQHELGNTQQARETLLGASQLLSNNATFYYNLACYETQLGNYAVAKNYLERSIEMDQSFAEFSKTDPDLKPLQGNSKRYRLFSRSE